MKFNKKEEKRPDQSQTSAPVAPVAAPAPYVAPSPPIQPPPVPPTQPPIQPPVQPPFKHTSQPKGNIMNPQNNNKPSLIRGGLSAPISRNNSSMAMDNIRKALEEMGAASDYQDYHFKFIELDTNGGRRKVAAMVIAVRAKNDPTSPIAFHAVLLEETGQAQRVKRRYDNVTYDDELFASDGFDQYMREDVVKAVATSFVPGGVVSYNKDTNETTVNGVKLISAMASTVPSTVNLKEPGQVRGPLSNACIAALTLLNQEIGRSDDLKLEGNVSAQRWTANVLMSNASFTDLTGTPNRGEVVVEIREGGSDNGQNQYDQSYNDPNGETMTHQVLGFMDLLYDPTPAAAQMQQNNAMYASSMMMMGGMTGGMLPADAFQVFRGRYTMTHIDPIFHPTLPDILFALAGVNVGVLEDDRWKVGLIAQHNLGADNLVSGRNMRDLGILGAEIMRPGVGEQAGQFVRSRFATSGHRGEDAVLYKILTTCVRPEPLLSLHVPESGAFSWMLGYFVAAALGSQSAQGDILSAADYMTRNECGRIYTQLCNGVPQPVVLNDNVLVNLGRYTDHNGMLRDSREVDQLVVENAFAETRPEMVDRWIRMQNDTSMPVEFRLSETRMIIKELYQNVTFTGRARAITFNPLFLRALCQGIVACGGRMHLRHGNENPQSTMRSTATFLQGVQFGTGQSGLYTANYTQPPQNNMFGGGGVFGRWNR